MQTFKLILEYDGTDFAGWQSQAAGRRTVQGVLEAAIARVCGARRIRLVGAGRTDAGVHAEGQVASVSLATRLLPEELARALNAVLPDDLAVVGLMAMPGAFHARRDAVSKLYRYRIWNGARRSALRARTAYAVPVPLDVAAMREAARALEGTHDFAGFQSTGSSATTTVRTLLRLDVCGAPGDEIAIEVEGTGFLRHMVRALVGTLLEVGSGKRPAESMSVLLAARDRGQAGPTAPARGLTLVRVDYGNPRDPDRLAVPPA
ncbi:MAG: tRNA pseudouridine(38-40) synthase TruA [Deltaproteobacteria bacterium]|nr:MAG: tRNA pseudouridine(38-40) synthase TruA [Deltaproteobacteria bacterium]